MPGIFDNIEASSLPALHDNLRASERSDFCVDYFTFGGGGPSQHVDSTSTTRIESSFLLPMAVSLSNVGTGSEKRQRRTVRP